MSQLHFRDNQGQDLSENWRSYLDEICTCERCRSRVEDALKDYAEDAPRDNTDFIKIEGRCAIAHAVRVHERLERQLQRLRGVSASDVGFAVNESGHQFENVLAIRLHVTRKLSPDELGEAGILDLTDLRWAKKACESFGPQLSQKLAKDCQLLAKKCQLLAKKRLILPVIDEKNNWPSRYPLSAVQLKDIWFYSSDVSPSRDRLTISGVPLDIIQARYFPSGASDSGIFADSLKSSKELTQSELLRTGRSRVDPLVGGLSVGSTTGQAGTLGTVVWDRTDGTPCILSNWHVLAGNLEAQVGQPVFQPALFDGGTELDKVAELKRWHLGEFGDAALAEISGHRDYASAEVLGLFSPLSDFQEPELLLKVRKWGRTTGITDGFIDGIHLSINIDYGGMVRHFKNQFHIAPLYSGVDFSQGGDSGSLVFVPYRPKDLIEGGFRLGKVFQEKSLSNGEWTKLCNELREYFKGLDDRRPNLYNLAQKLDGDEHSSEPFLLQLQDRDEIRKAFESGNPKLRNFDQILNLLAACTPSLVRDLSPAIAKHLNVDLAAALKRHREANREREEDLNRSKLRAFFAVGMIFAGDTPGSPFGEFAVASPLKPLAEELQFSLRPVFGSRTSFRQLHRPHRWASEVSGGAFAPGEPSADERGKGPQPDFERSQGGGNKKPP